MNNIHNITCPGCDSPDRIKNIVSGVALFYWNCDQCGTRIQTEAETGEILLYAFYIDYNDASYEGSFFLKTQVFRLDYWTPGKFVHNLNLRGSWQSVFRLDFLPNWNINTFAHKLPTLLTFH